MAKKYVNGRWVTVEDTLNTSSTTTKSSSSPLPDRPTPTEVQTSSTGDNDGTGNDSEKEFEEKSYDITSGSIALTKADMGIACRGAVNLQGLGSVLSGTYYVSGVKISINDSGMKQTITVHRDSLGKKSTSKKTTRSPAVTPTKSPKKTYTVVSGDSLWKIASKKLGNGNRWKEIYNLNKSKIKNPNLIYVGQVFTLP